MFAINIYDSLIQVVQKTMKILQAKQITYIVIELVKATFYLLLSCARLLLSTQSYQFQRCIAFVEAYHLKWEHD